MKKFDYDAIVIGSGFGGSVMTCRLAEKGYSVCLLERGRRYGYGEFPRHTHEAKGLFWDPEDDLYGLYEFNFFPKSDAYIVAGSGLGGGSLVYANILMKMPEDFFQTWPGGITRKKLDPYYDKALKMLEGRRYPYETDPYYNQTPKTKAFIEAFDSLSPGKETTSPPEREFPHLAIRFKGDFPGAQSKNNQGIIQSSCIKCGECDIGCNFHAKNTLDLNYIARAESRELLGTSGKAATVKTHALVYDIEPLPEGGFIVRYRHPKKSEGGTGEISARKVILSAGSYGSTGLLLKLKAKGRLPKISSQLGLSWCGNGDLEGTILDIPKEVYPTVGPVITTVLKYRFKSYPDGFPHGLYIQEGGFPSLVAWYLTGKAPSPSAFVKAVQFAINTLKRFFGKDKEIRIGDDILSMLDRDDFVRRSMVLLGMGRDRSTGRMFLNEDDKVDLEWKMKEGSKYHVDRVRNEMARLAGAMGGKFLLNPMTYFDKVIAVHPLGGCVMADRPEEGVVNTGGEVYGYPGLHVVDASIMPSSTGVNPSLTIAAVAEMIAENF
jgi:cholesterol oxidase